MKRLGSALRLDLLIQVRYGFLAGAIISALLWIALLKPLSAPLLTFFLPPALLFDLALVGFYFLSILVLYDKGQATLSALVISPLRFWEYLASKLITLTLLAIILSLALVLFTYGIDFHLGWFLLGAALMASIALLVGFVAVAPFRSVTSYMMPSGVYVTWLSLPMVSHLGWWDHALILLSPTQGSLWLLKGAFGQIENWQVVFALVSSLVWMGVLTLLARYMFNRFLVERKGRR